MLGRQWRKWRHRDAPEPTGEASPTGAPDAPPDDSAPDVRVRLLGPFEVTVGDVRLQRCGSLKGLAVLQYLLMHGRRARREELMDLLWPGYRPQSARNNLNVAIYALRRWVEAADPGQDLLLYSDGCYVLSPELWWWLDLEEFAAAVAAGDAARSRGELTAAADAYLRAVGLYRGPLLEDAVHADWLVDDQRRVQERFLAANEALAELYLDAGDVGGAVTMGERVLRTDPCRESTHRLLMRCFARQHQGQLIARQFRRCSEALDRDLGLRPARETQRLYRELTGALSLNP